MLRYKTNRN